MGRCVTDRGHAGRPGETGSLGPVLAIPVDRLLSDLKNAAATPDQVIDLKIPGVYFLFCGDNLVYVGQSKHVPDRIADHVREKRLLFDRVAFISVPPEKLLETESYYIDLLWPLENRTGDREKIRKQLEEIELNWAEEEIEASETDSYSPGKRSA